MSFTQTIRVSAKDGEAIAELMREWDDMQSRADIMGYIGGAVLANRDEPDSYLIIADFGEVEPGVSSVEEAELNNQREQTQQWAVRLREVIEGEPVYHNYDELYWTGFTDASGARL